MNRAQILWLETWIALSGMVFWLLPEQLPYTPVIAIASALWALLSLASIWIEDLEDWAYRLASFFGFLLCTIEGILGLLALAPKSGLLIISALHAFSFILAVIGKYQSKNRRRPKRNYDQVVKDIVERAEKSDSHND